VQGRSQNRDHKNAEHDAREGIFARIEMNERVKHAVILIRRSLNINKIKGGKIKEAGAGLPRPYDVSYGLWLLLYLNHLGPKYNR